MPGSVSTISRRMSEKLRNAMNERYSFFRIWALILGFSLHAASVRLPPWRRGAGDLHGPWHVTFLVAMALPMRSMMRSTGSAGTPACLRRAAIMLAILSVHRMHTSPWRRSSAWTVYSCAQLLCMHAHADRVYCALPGELARWGGLLCWRGRRLALCGGRLSSCGGLS